MPDGHHELGAVTVLSTSYPSELAEAESLLQACGIAYVVGDEDADETGVIEIRVAADDAPAAFEVLAELR